MQIPRGAAVFISAMAFSMPSLAATVTPEQGIVLVNHGNGYKNVTGPTRVNPGDIVVVNPGGTAQLSYDDGCSVPVAVGSIVTVGAKSPCAMQGSKTPTLATIPPPPVGESVLEGGAAPPTGEPFALPDITNMLPGLAIGGGALGVLLATQKKDKQASP